MNTRKGMQRLAVFVGVLGAIAGGFASYLGFRDVIAASARHKVFELLANSDVVQQERNSWPLTIRYTPRKAIETFRKLPENQQREVFGSLTQEERADLAAKLKCEPIPSGSPSTATTLGNLSQVDRWAQYADDPYACSAESIDPPKSQVNKGGIMTINWSRKLSVDSIETVDGQTVFPSPAPGFWLYLLPAFFPMLGFFIPWGLVSAVGWVGAGFFETPKL